ncbi:MAG: hypothetical protein GY750_16070 [Lentisphaerae bacterium]|nr:hypothetical protein [Lentisphaerota bacterium]MCP4102912.1 hypothetical protein [Lentisphaerota bacterium]
MSFQKVLYFNPQQPLSLKSKFLLSYVCKGYHAFVTLSQRVNGRYYIMNSIGLLLTDPDSGSCRSVSQLFRNQKACVRFDSIAKRAQRVEVYAIHFAVNTQRATDAMRKMFEFENANRVLGTFFLLKRNCHNFAAYFMVVNGIIDDRFLGNFYPNRNDSYSLDRVYETRPPHMDQNEFINSSNDYTAAENQLRLVRHKLDVGGRNRSSLTTGSSGCSSEEEEDSHKCLFRWPNDIHIRNLTTFSPKTSLFAVADDVNPMTAYDSRQLRFKKAKAVLRTYVNRGWGRKRNYNNEVENLLSSRDIHSVQDLLDEVFKFVKAKEFHPNMNGDLMKRVAFIDFFLKEDLKVRKVNCPMNSSEKYQIDNINSSIEHELHNIGVRYNLKKQRLYIAYICNYFLNDKKQLYHEALAT